jgi:hypothetical protein
MLENLVKLVKRFMEINFITAVCKVQDKKWGEIMPFFAIISAREKYI